MAIQLDQKTPSAIKTDRVEERQQKRYQELKRKTIDGESKKVDILEELDKVAANLDKTK